MLLACVRGVICNMNLNVSLTFTLFLSRLFILHARTHAHTHARTHTRTHAHAHTHSRICIHVYARTYALLLKSEVSVALFLLWVPMPPNLLAILTGDRF